MKRISVVLFILLALGISMLGCGKSEDQVTSDVQNVEIKEYKGQRLGSIGDFRENSIKGIQEVDIEQYVLKVDGMVETPKSFNYQQLSEMEHIKKVIILNCVEGWSVKALWEGIHLDEIFSKVNPMDKANTVIFYSPDGYSTSLDLAYIKKHNIMIADKINEVKLPPRQGFPFQLVAESKWGYKWIRWLNHIEISDNSDYKGFWESKGYSDEGNIDEPMFD